MLVSAVGLILVDSLDITLKDVCFYPWKALDACFGLFQMWFDNSDYWAMQVWTA